MKKNILNLAVTVAMLSAYSALAEDFSGAYVGAQVGTNRSDLSGTTSTSRDSATAYGINGGYGWNLGSTVLGVNAFYNDSNNQTHSQTTPTVGSLSYGVQTYGLGLKLGMPINNFMPYVKLGYGSAEGSGNYTSSARGANGGLGLEYKFTPNWSVAGEWSTTSPSNNGTKLNSDTFSIGLNYYFGTPAAAPAPVPMAAPEPAPAPAPQPAATAPTPVRLMKVSFSADSLFAFNKSELRPAGKESLDKFASDLKHVNLEVVTVTGHTDRLGSHAYNMKLSMRRAEVVKDYLVKSGGIATDKIVAKGVDGADSVTKPGQCKGKKATKKLIACLQPDRRVEVEVSGTK
jgi:OmpA-OmpF porin, OOP family